MSSVMNVRQANKHETRQALINAGMLEFAENGLDAPSLDSICARAGKTRGAFYVHFADRDELLVAVFEHVLSAFHAAVITPDDDAQGLFQTILAFASAVAVNAPAVRNDGPWRFHHTLAACARSPQVRSRYADLHVNAIERVNDTARRGQRAGTVRDDVAAERIGELLVTVALGITAMREVGVPFDLSGCARALLQLLAAPPSPKKRKARSSRARRTLR
jgi:TetR/AcrR family transcriptional regulator, transcriptional repressor for nem operon